MEKYDKLVEALRCCATMTCKGDECKYMILGCHDCWQKLHDDAAAAIEALKAEIRESMQKCAECSKWNEPIQVGKAGNKFTLNATEQPHWVSVDEPPKKHGKYPVCWVEKGNFYWEEAHYCFYQDGDKWTAWSSYQGDDVEITPDYWMPIEPPKEDA